MTLKKLSKYLHVMYVFIVLIVSNRSVRSEWQVDSLLINNRETSALCCCVFKQCGINAVLSAAATIAYDNTSTERVVNGCTFEVSCLEGIVYVQGCVKVSTSGGYKCCFQEYASIAVRSWLIRETKENNLLWMSWLVQVNDYRNSFFFFSNLIMVLG